MREFDTYPATNRIPEHRPDSDPTLAKLRAVAGDLAHAPPDFAPSAYEFTRGDRIRRYTLDLALDAFHTAAGIRRRLDRLAAATPICDVVILSVYSKNETGSRITEAAASLSHTRHRVRFAYGSRDAEADPRLRQETIATGLDGLLFENLNRLLEIGSGEPPPRWTIVHGSDVGFPRRWLDRFIALCESFDFAIAGPANTRRSYTSYALTQRSLRWLVRDTGFVESGPVFAFRQDAAAELLPFPSDLGQGWGVDFYWPYLAQQRRWRMGIIDVTPIEHVGRPPGGSYSAQRAAESGREWLQRNPYVPVEIAVQTRAAYRHVPRVIGPRPKPDLVMAPGQPD